MSHRSIILAALACGTLLAVGPRAVQAQGPGGFRPGGFPPPGGRPGGAPMDRMVQALGLTPAQQAKVRPLLEAEHKQIQAIHETYRAKISAILTPAQRKKLSEMRPQGPPPPR